MNDSPNCRRHRIALAFACCHLTGMGLRPLPALAASSPVQAVSVRDPAVRAPASAAGYSALPSLSFDGRFVAFVSSAQNLAPGDANGAVLDVFVRDRIKGEVQLVSVNPAGQASGDDTSFAPAISANGRRVVFESAARNLVTNFVSGAGDVYLRDLEAGVTRLVSVNLGGNAGGLGASGEPEVTPDGRLVVFASAAPNLVANDANRATDVFVRNLEAGRVSLVSVNYTGTASAAVTNGAARGSGNAVISEDGGFVAFESDAIDLVADRLDGRLQVFVRDLRLGRTQLASVDPQGIPSTNGWSGNPLLSADGRHVVFLSTGAGLAPGAAGGLPAVYRRDLQTQTTVRVSPVSESGEGEAAEPCLSRDGRFVAFTWVAVERGASEIRLWDAESGSSEVVSVNTRGEEASGSSGEPRLSADGRVVTFISDATNLVMGVTGGANQVYIRDLATRETRLASGPGVDGTSGSRADCLYSVLSSDGSVVAFLAADGGLVPDDLNQEMDVFTRATGAPSVELVSAAGSGLDSVTGTGGSSLTSRGISRDGRFVLFSSLAPDLTLADTNQAYDVFLRDLAVGTNLLVSVNPQAGRAAAGTSHAPVMSPDGRHVLFFSNARDLFTPSTNAFDELYLRDVAFGTTELVSWSVDGSKAGGAHEAPPVLSASGRYVAFLSRTLEPPRYTREQLYLRDMATKTTVKVAPLTAGLPATAGLYPLAFAGDASLLLVQATNLYRYDVALRTSELIPLGISPAGQSLDLMVAVTPDGRYAALRAPRFVSQGQSRQWLGRYDFTSRTVIRVLERVGDSTLSMSGADVAISADGRLIAFSDTSRDLSPLDHNRAGDVFLTDLAHPGLVSLVSVNFAGTAAGNGDSDAPSLSADGRFVAFRSASTDLVSTPDGNGGPDIFVRDLHAGVTYLASGNQLGTGTGDERSTQPVISGDGTRVAFTSFASDLVAGDYNQRGDVFVYSVAEAASADEDRDGLPDAWERWHFGNLARDGAGDFDGDGQSNRDELLARTVPTDAGSALRLSIEPGSESNQVFLSWTAVAGREDRAQYTEELGDAPTWHDVPSATTVVAPQTLSIVAEIPATGGSARFYRLVVEVPGAGVPVGSLVR